MSYPSEISLTIIETARDKVRNSETANRGRVQRAVSYYLGQSHTRRLPSGLTMVQQELARNVVLAALSAAGLLKALPLRIAERLLTPEERENGKVNFVGLSGRRRRGVPVVVVGVTKSPTPKDIPSKATAA